MSIIVAFLNFFLLSIFSIHSVEAKDFEIGEFTPEKAIELLLEEPLDEAVTYSKDDKGPICEYRSKSLRFLVRYCDNQRKGRIAGTIVHIKSEQAVSYFIMLKAESDFDFELGYIPELFAWRAFNFYSPFVDYDPEGKKVNSPICEVGFFTPQNPDPLVVTPRQNFSKCDPNTAATYQKAWLASGQTLRDNPNDERLVKLTKLHISKFSTPNKKQ